MNTNYIWAAASFIAGSAIGVAASWFITKKHYEKKHQEEMDVVWKDLQKSNSKPEPKKSVSETAKDIGLLNTDIRPIMTKPDLTDYANRIRKEGYEAPKLDKTDDYIYEIEYHDLDEDNYKRIDLTLYADGILADDGDIPVNDPIFDVGEHYLEWMEGKDEILIRNEKHSIDYDICRSMLTFGEMLDRHPETQQRIQFDDAMDEYYSDKYDEDNEEEEDDDE